MGEQLTIYTIGHSNTTVEALGDLLARHEIAALVDVRSRPYSGYATQFDQEDLQEFIEGRGLRYVYLGRELGGHPESPAYYDDEGYVRYDLIAASERFQEALSKVVRAAEKLRVALLCSEEDPTECHRRLLLARVLRERGAMVLHLRADGRAQTEEEIAHAEELEKTAGQRSLFDLEDEPQWRSTQSVTPRKAPPSSSIC
jgi:uncharacterized protein (DUF488 family)